MRRRIPWVSAWTLLTLLAMAAALRPPIAGVGPLLPVIGSDLELSGDLLALFGAIPVIGFGLGAFFTPKLAEHFASWSLMRAVMVALTLAMLWRSAGGAVALFAGTSLIGLVIAVGNTILPTIVRADFPRQIGLATGLYTTTFAAFAGLASWLAVPLAGPDGTDWQRSLSLPAGLAVIALALSFLPGTNRAEHSPHAPRLGAVLRNRSAWTITLFMGLQSTGFYATLTWLPTFLQSNGYTPLESGAWLSYVGTIGIPLGLALPLLTSRLRSLAGAAVACSAVAAVGTFGLALFPTAQTTLWLTLMGLGQGLAFPIGLALIAARTKHPATTTALSAMAQGFGYIVAAVGTYLIGWVHNLASAWQPAMITFALFAVGQTVIARWAGSERPVES